MNCSRTVHEVHQKFMNFMNTFRRGVTTGFGLMQEAFWFEVYACLIGCVLMYFEVCACQMVFVAA